MPDGAVDGSLAAPRDVSDASPAALGAPRQASHAEPLAEVALGGQAGEHRLYTYRIPATLSPTLRPGHLVEVPFGKRVLQGLVVATGTGQREGLRLRDITALLDPLPCLTPAQIDLAYWIADYYGCSLDDALGVMVPAGIEREPVAEYSAAPGIPAAPPRLTPLQQEVLEAVRGSGPVTATRLANGRDYAQLIRALEALTRRKLLTRTVHLGRAAVIERTEQIVVLQPHPHNGKLTERQQAVVAYLQQQGGEARLGQLKADLGIDTSLVMRLQHKRIVVTYARQVRRDPLSHRSIPAHPAPALTAEQAEVYAAIRASLARQTGDIFLLHGVTGSGKTEVYLRAVADTLSAGRQAIVLVPEIGLTPQTVGRFAGRFPGQVALLHSRLSDGERFDEWQRIRGGDCGVVVGPRSAIFSPVARPGLIVLDEEHDGSYKQDRTPRYHTRDVAARLATITGATVILGSATPDVVSFNRADAGEYRLLSMPNRVGYATPGASATNRTPMPAATDHGLPPVLVVDMRLELKAGNRSMFSRALLRALEATLSRREQAILFLNRRGNATFVNCRDCGRVVKCLRCDLPFSYHSDGERLQCHRCDARAALPTVCAGCGSWRIRYFGLGTQKVEQEIATRFPRARVQRYDRDVVTGKLDHEQILERFARHEADILIGTQIVAKGLDFARVTLVGAVSADTSLNLPDFRAAERTFQLLTQVAGRAGRAALPGMVIVQTYTPGHFAIQAAAHHDYAAFYHDELRFRADGNYPPFSQLLRLTYSARTEAACRLEAERLAESLERWLAINSALGLELIGPAPCFINKANNSYFWQILVRGADVHPILSHIPHGWAIDVDPMSML